MKTKQERLEIIKRWMQRQLERGQNCERTNARYRELFKDAKYYENQFKVKGYETKMVYEKQRR
jgi:hypothetical protein